MVHVDNNIGALLQEAGWHPSDIQLLVESAHGGDIRRVLRGEATLKISEHVIDLSSGPDWVPGPVVGYDSHARIMAGHSGKGLWRWSEDAVELHEMHQTCDHRRCGDMSAEGALNATVLEFLYEHPHLWPKAWKGMRVYFWGSRYRNGCDYFLVRYLQEKDGELSMGYSNSKPCRLPSPLYVARMKV